MARKKKSDEEYLRDWLTQKLRRLSFQWPPRKAVLKKARVSRGKYECELCKEEGIDQLYGPKEIVMDHKEPVIDPVDGWVDWNTYISRLFCREDNWSVLCHHHHDIKTAIENEVRKNQKKS